MEFWVNDNDPALGTIRREIIPKWRSFRLVKHDDLPKIHSLTSVNEGMQLTVFGPLGCD